MRTTIEISDDKRAKLLAIAARRRLRGYSQLIDEALELYLAREEAKRQNKLNEVLALAGTLSDDDAAKVEERIAEVWMKWR